VRGPDADRRPAIDLPGGGGVILGRLFKHRHRHPRPPAGLRPRTQSNRKRLGISARQQTRDHRVRRLRRIVDKACAAWNVFADDPKRIASITDRSWETVNP